jgi:UDP-GlcNAc3NAcA epimerase
MGANFGRYIHLLFCIHIVEICHLALLQIHDNYRFRVIALCITNSIHALIKLQLISNSRIVLTDSGGLQKEAYFFNKFCVTLREQTEWTELVDNGYNFLVGSSTQRILEQFSDLRERVFVKKEELYGGGNTAINICNHLVKHYAN